MTTFDLTTALLGLSTVGESEDNAYLTVNDWLRLVKALNAGVVDRDLSTPPGSPSEGDLYIVAASPAGDWSSFSAGDLAFFSNAAWHRVVPYEGLAVWVKDEDTPVVWRADQSPSAWEVFPVRLVAALNAQDNVLQRPELKDYAESKTAVTPAGSPLTATLDLEAGNVFTVTVTADTTFVFSNPPAAGKAGSWTLIYTDNSGSPQASPTWPAAVVWPGASPPTMTAGGTDVVTFLTVDGGSTVYGFVAGQAFA